MPTTSQLFGLSPQEQAAATFTALGEAGPGKDLFGPYVTLLNRRMHGSYGKNVLDMATAPQQFVANDRYSPSQVADPSFGRKVYGSRYDQAYNALNDPTQIAPVFNQLRGATSFRGQALLNKKQKDDQMLDPKGNFYFDYNPSVFQKGQNILKTNVGSLPPAPTTSTNSNQQNTSGKTYNIYVDPDNLDQARTFLSEFLPKITGQATATKSEFDPSKVVEDMFYDAFKPKIYA